MKRKSIALLLALVMCLGLTVTAFAAEAETATETIDGITVTANANGTISYTGTGIFAEKYMSAGFELLCKVSSGTNNVTISISSGITGVTDEYKNKFSELLCESGMAGAVTFNDSPGSAPAPVVETVGGFTDVKAGDYFADPVLWAVEQKITAGTSDTTFSPNANCTVAQILTFLWRANGSPKSSGSNPFSTVLESAYFYDAAVWAYEKGMVPGGELYAGEPCTRSMAVTYMWKAAGSPAASAGKFTDVPADADYAQAVSWAVEKGITSGTSADAFSPDGVCTRGQIVTFLYRGLAK